MRCTIFQLFRYLADLKGFKHRYINEKFVNREAKLAFGEFYHIYNKAIGSDKLFITDKDYSFFLKKLERFIFPIADIFAYCLIPNHFHLLIRIKSEDEVLKLLVLKKNIDPILYINQSFRNYFNSYTKSFNLAHNRMGRLFLYSYKRILVDDENYLLSLITYIHRNPIHHGLTNDYSSWKYSSYSMVLSKEPTMIKRDEVIELFGSLEEFNTFHQDSILQLELSKYLQEFD